MLRSEDGAPLAWVSVLACQREICFYGESGSDGRFSFQLDSPGALLIKTAADLTATPRRTSPMVSVTIEGEEFLDIGDVYAPSMPPGVPVETAAREALTLDLGEGLSLELTPSSLTLPPGETLTEVAARRLSEATTPAYPGIAREDILAVYALHPFGATSSVAIGVRVKSDLPSGTPVSFLVIDDTDGTVSGPVRGAANGTELVTDPGEGIAALTHLLVTR
jgi:hypothetical protein